MPAISAWLTATPWNAILGLSLSLLLPFAPILSGGVMALLVLALGPQRAGLAAAGAVVLLGLLFWAFGDPLQPLLVSAGVAWLPAALLGLLTRQTRSLTLSLQVSVLFAVAATIGFFVVFGDPAGYWTAQLVEIGRWFEELGLEAQSRALTEQRELLAPQMTMIFVFVTWSIWVLVLVLGYALFQQLPEQAGRYGRFADLDFGRVLAIAMVATVLVTLLVNAAVLQNLAFVLFVAFWMQGLAVIHWLRAEGVLPLLAVIAVYALLPVLNVLLVMVLAVLGYTDAWFGYRPRIAAARKARQAPRR